MQHGFLATLSPWLGVIGSLSSFAKLGELRELNLWNCSGLTGTLDQVSCMHKLRSLKLYKCITLEGPSLRSRGWLMGRPDPDGAPQERWYPWKVSMI